LGELTSSGAWASSGPSATSDFLGEQWRFSLRRGQPPLVPPTLSRASVANSSFVAAVRDQWHCEASGPPPRPAILVGVQREAREQPATRPAEWHVGSQCWGHGSSLCEQ
ncbi:hypothetical protein Dimus_014629, partial [Dionaea muscipula]